MSDYDSPWKEAIDLFFEAFLALFFPEAHADIDWSREYESLDKELQQIAPEAELGRRYVDKLVKVWLKSGGSIVIETVFTWPGLGRLLVDSVSYRDYPVIQAEIMLFSAEFVFINLFVDLLYAVVNPEIRLT